MLLVLLRDWGFVVFDCSVFLAMARFANSRFDSSALIPFLLLLDLVIIMVDSNGKGNSKFEILFQNIHSVVSSVHG